MVNNAHNPVRRGGPVAATRRCMARYAQFSGRASRREFWWFWLVCVTGLWVALIFDSILLAREASADSAARRQTAPVFLPVTSAFALAVALPEAFQERALWFAVPYVLVRLIGMGLYSWVASTNASLRAAVTTLSNTPEGGAALVLGPVPFDALIAWLDAVQATTGYRLQRAILSADVPGSVRASTRKTPASGATMMSSKESPWEKTPSAKSPVATNTPPMKPGS